MVLPRQRSKKRRRVDPTLISQAPDPLPYSPEDNFFELPESYLEDFSLLIDVRLLFCRKQFHALFKFLNSALHTRRVNPPRWTNPYTLGWILGSPGTGKSTTVLAFLWTLSREMWAFTWLHLEDGELCCVQVEGSEKRTLISLESGRRLRTLLDTFLGQVHNNQRHVVFLDGFTADYKTLYSICRAWLKNNYEMHRLVIVCSLSHRGKNSEATDARLQCKEFLLDSWTKEQYIEAVKEDKFYDNARLNLDATGPARGISRQELVDSKFYFAGGSCRYMFGFSTKMVIESIDIALSAVRDIVPYIEGTIGLRSDGAVNRLFSCYHPMGIRTTTAIVSRYAATELAVLRGPRLIDRLAQCLSEHLNPAMDGWLFEMRFFSRISREGVTVYVDGEVLETLPRAYVDRVDTSNIESVPDNAVWWKPQMWNQGGYDAVFVDKSNNTVLFIQLTIAARHTFKIDQFYRLLTQLKDHMEIRVMEIFFLSPKGIRPKISQVSGHGLLDPFDGWQKGGEKDAVKNGWVDFSFES